MFRGSDVPESPNAESIGQIAEIDLREGPCFTLVMGTSMKVPEAKRQVRELCHAAKARGGMTVWINKEAPPSSLLVSTLILTW